MCFVATAPCSYTLEVADCPSVAAEKKSHPSGFVLPSFHGLDRHIIRPLGGLERRRMVSSVAWQGASSDS